MKSSPGGAKGQRRNEGSADRQNFLDNEDSST